MPLPGGFTLAAWNQNVDPAGVLLPITAVPDPHLTTQGADIRVPETLTNIIGEHAMANDASLVRAQLQSPSLRAFVNIDKEPIVAAAIMPNSPLKIMHANGPIPVKETEGINMAIQSDPAAAVQHWGLIWFADGKRVPVDGQIYTIRFTGAAALAAGAWVNTNVTFLQNLPVGSYQVVGMRVRGANLVAARLVFQGGYWRPGCPGVSTLAQVDIPEFRFGGLGVWGVFDNTTPPTMDCLGITDTSQIGEMDIIKL